MGRLSKTATSEVNGGRVMDCIVGTIAAGVLLIPVARAISWLLNAVVISLLRAVVDTDALMRDYSKFETSAVKRVLWCPLVFIEAFIGQVASVAKGRETMVVRKRRIGGAR